MTCNVVTIAATSRLISVLGLLLIISGAALSAEKQVIIGFRERPGASGESLVLKAKGRIARTFRLIPAISASIPEGEMEKLRRNPAIAYVEENAVYTTAADLPGDGEGSNSWHVPFIGADAAHASGNLGTGVKVAILDTGLDYTHEDLVGNYRGGYDFVFDDNDPFDDSFHSHGTHLAGIVAAEKNGIGVVGMAPESEIYAVKVLDGAGFGMEDWIIAGIEWAVSNRVDIINMSLTGPDRQGLREACERARSAGVLLVAAGGNSLAGGGSVRYPAAYDSVIAVTATDELGFPGYFTPLGGALELAAPGVEIFSTVAGGNYSALSGTSQAAACVSGAAALYIRSLGVDVNGDQRIDNEDVRLMLQVTAMDLGDVGRDATYGYGLVNALAASLEDLTTLTVTATRPRPGDDATDDMVVAKVTDGVYRVRIINSGLTRVVMDVFEGATYRGDLSRTIFLAKSRFPKGHVQRLDATGTSYLLLFTPYGRTGTSAEIRIRRARD